VKSSEKMNECDDELEKTKALVLKGFAQMIPMMKN
jgi:hypothetical protein